MEEYLDIPAESMRHIEALLQRHPPQVIQRMFQQTIESRRNSAASSFTSMTTSTTSSWQSRLSVASTFSTSTGNSDFTPSIASSTSSRSKIRRPEPRSYPTDFEPARPIPPVLTPASEMSGSPLDIKPEPSFTPTDEDASNASPIVFSGEQGQMQAGDSYMFCTYCAEQKSLKTFKAKSDWKKHEMRMHETGEDWPCIVLGCNRIFDRQKDFVKHHQRYHSGRPLPSLTDIGITLLPRRVFGCGFDRCKEVSIGWDERCDHVAKHMKNGATFEQWKYSNVIRNLIRQEALHDTWKEMVACLDERLRESRSQISWRPENTRILRQKLQCCDLRPNREEVLITALSLRSDIPLDPSQIQFPPGFAVPSRDSVPNVDQLSREQRMHILNGNPNTSLSRKWLASVNAALLQNCSLSAITSFESTNSPYPESPALDNRRISYMDLDTDRFLDVGQPDIPALPPTVNTAHLTTSPITEGQSPQTPTFVDPAKAQNPLSWYYPNYFDNAPSIEESPYYDRPSLGQMISKPLHSISTRLGNSRLSSPHSRPASRAGNSDVGSDFAMQSPIHPYEQQQQQQQQQQHHQPSSHPLQYRSADAQMHDQLHMFTNQA